MDKISRYLRISLRPWLLEALLAARALLFVGTRYTCPCCGWRLRGFTHGGTSLKVRHLGYCPRCNSKARQRRLWLFLGQETDLLSDHLRLLHVAPNFSLSRRLMRMRNIDYVGVEYGDRLYTSVRPQFPKVDLTAIPFGADTFDASICHHVLEHLTHDRKAMRELFRALKPGGWIVISSPIQWDQKTFEDPTITSPEERLRAFGEKVHVRIYGYDLVDRLEECGFRVQLDLGEEVEQHIRDKYGLRDDEHIFYCTKA